MTYALIAVPYALVVVLLWMLVQGQPMAQQAEADRVTVLATEVVRLRATVQTLPQPTRTCSRGYTLNYEYVGC